MNTRAAAFSDSSVLAAARPTDPGSPDPSSERPVCTKRGAFRGTQEEQGASETLIFLNTRHLQRYPPQTPRAVAICTGYTGCPLLHGCG